MSYRLQQYRVSTIGRAGLRPFAPGPLVQTTPGPITEHLEDQALLTFLGGSAVSVRVLMACPSPYSLPAAVLYPHNSRNYQVSSPESYSFFPSLYRKGASLCSASGFGIKLSFILCLVSFLSRVPGAVWGLRHGAFLVCIVRMFQTRRGGGG